jgi:hypothetical protein
MTYYELHTDEVLVNLSLLPNNYLSIYFRDWDLILECSSHGPEAYGFRSWNVWPVFEDEIQFLEFHRLEKPTSLREGSCFFRR